MISNASSFGNDDSAFESDSCMSDSCTSDIEEMSESESSCGALSTYSRPMQSKSTFGRFLNARNQVVDIDVDQNDSVFDMVFKEDKKRHIVMSGWNEWIGEKST